MRAGMAASAKSQMLIYIFSQVSCFSPPCFGHVVSVRGFAGKHLSSGLLGWTILRRDEDAVHSL